MISMTLNGRNIEVSKNENLVEIAKAHGVHIPTFCYGKQLKAFSGCRICVVEVERRQKKFRLLLVQLSYRRNGSRDPF